MAKTPIVRGELPDKFKGLSAAQLREYLKCRRFMHAWGDAELWSIVRNKRTRRQQLRLQIQCDRCDSLRVEMATIATGDRIGTPNYHYSEGYQLAKGEKFTARDRSALRLYAAARAKITIEEE